ncbi:hypothetical protein [Streptomyces sp. NPDC001978]
MSYGYAAYCCVRAAVSRVAARRSAVVAPGWSGGLAGVGHGTAVRP